MKAIKINNTYYLKKLKLSEGETEELINGDIQFLGEIISIEINKNPSPMSSKSLNTIKDYFKTIGLECNWEIIEE